LEIPWELQVQCFVNMGLFHGRIGLKEEMVQFLEKAIAIKHYAAFKAHAECCVALSEMGRHYDAYQYSRTAVELSWRALVSLLTNLYHQFSKALGSKGSLFYAEKISRTANY